MPVPRKDQVVLIQALVRLRVVGCQHNCGDPSPKVIPCTLDILTAIYPVNVMVGEVDTNLLVNLRYAINYFEKVQGSLGGASPKEY